MSGDITLITVAHRLQTLMDSDKIVCYFILSIVTYIKLDYAFQMVLDAGRLVSVVAKFSI